VIAVGDNGYGQCDVANWKDMVQVAAGYDHTIGLKSDGTVMTVGNNSQGECNVDHWTDIIQVVAGDQNSFALRLDGTVVAEGNNNYGQCNVDDWHLWVPDELLSRTRSDRATERPFTPQQRDSASSSTSWQSFFRQAYNDKERKK
jgi:alpha-tubulin suppressor-like RCC1 family protein